LEAQINSLVNDNLQSEKDYAKYIEKYKNKYGDFQSIKIENGELNFKNEEKK
jgi:hypothetical protein